MTATPRGTSKTASIQQSSPPKKDLATPFPMGRGDKGPWQIPGFRSTHRTGSTTRHGWRDEISIYIYINVCVCVFVCVSACVRACV